jgi:uncharacterized protein
VTYWDSSALVPLMVTHSTSTALERVRGMDAAGVTWWGTQVECASALARLEHEGRLDARGANAALARMRGVLASFDEVQPTDSLRSTAQRLLRSHRLRAADALQLAAALEASQGRPMPLDIVCLDSRLADAARREGLTVLTADG